VSWQLSTLAVLALALAVGFAWFERERPPARVVALVAALAALAVVGRLAFAAVPNVKPTTDIVLFAGYALGPAPGFAVGAVTAVVSNIFLSQGPWTAWQMAGWGGVGVAGALVARVFRGREPNRFALAGVCALAGLAFGAWMDVYQWTLAARQDLDSYLAVSATSLPYNLAHALGNFLFCLLIGPAFVRALRRYRRRLEVTWSPAPAGVACALVALALVGGAAAGPAEAAPADRAVRYLLRAQNDDGGFSAAPGQRSSDLYSGWAGLGLAAAGHNPRDVRRPGGRSLVSYLRRRARSVRDVGEVERTILLLKAAGLPARRFGGRDLAARVERRRRGDGSISGYVSYTAFGVLALRSAGEPAGRPMVTWLVRSQNPDGGFGVARSSPSDSDMTGAVLQALAVTGRARGKTARQAVARLKSTQNGDGGFGQMEGRSSNAQSTAYAVQGLVAVGAAPGAVRRAVRYLTGLQRSDGSVAYSETSSQTPVWVTAQALAALRREPLPIAAVPRRRPAAPAAAAPEAAAPAVEQQSQSPPPSARAAPRRRAASGAPAAEDEPAPARPLPRRPEPEPPPVPPTVEGERARASDDPGRGTPAGLLAAAAVGGAGLLLLGRRRLRRRRSAAG
jgi:energy-coupling factor transport system substrate-specific component